MAKEISVWQKKPRKGKKKAESITRTVTIKNRLGLHARAAASFVKLAFRYRSDIDLVEGKKRANGKSIMGLLTLAASQGTEVIIEATGADAERAIAALAKLVDNKFGEA